jgi:hypothetical protein
MLAVLLTWCYIFITGINLGFGLHKIFRIQVKDFIISVFLGLFLVTLLAGYWAVFGRIHLEFHSFLLLLNLIICLSWKSEIGNSYRTFFEQIRGLSRAARLFLIFYAVLVLAISAAPSSFTDNETYYIQTIKWLNEYGFVKGLANLHIFFGQTSGWHILQSAFNFSFLELGLNRLNGFCVLMGAIYGVLKMDTFKLGGFLPLVIVFLFPYIAVPSPDVAVCIISFIVFCYFLEHFDDGDPEAFNVILILSVFIVLIKTTTLPILLLPLLLLIRNFNRIIPKIATGGLFAMAALLLFLAKNAILTGLPLFPTSLLKTSANLDFAIPTPIYNLLFNDARLYDFVMPKAEYYNSGMLEVFIRWFFAPGKNAFHCLIILLVLAVPYFIRRFSNKNSYWILYLVMVLQLAFLFATSPQYRFMLHFIFFFGAFIVCCLIRQKTICYLHQLGLLPVVALLIGLQKTTFWGREVRYKNCTFSIENVISPSGNSNIDSDFVSITSGNLQYNSPVGNYFWVTGDGDLPCVNSKQIQYFARKTGYRPQLRTANIKDGFYPQKVNP